MANKKTALSQTSALRQEKTLPVADVCQFEKLARRSLPKMVFEFIRSGAADEITTRENRKAFDRLRLWPRAMVNVSEIDTRINLFGRNLECPLLLAPIAYHRLFHSEGELATARGANAAGVPFIVSTFTTTAIDQILDNTVQPVWFQLYVQRDPGLTMDLVDMAVSKGCAAVCITVDTPVMGCRYSQLQFALPAEMECVHLLQSGGKRNGDSGQRPGARLSSASFDPKFDWSDLERLRSSIKTPLLLKGMFHPSDCARALDAGVDGIIVSNHGGRNLDTVPAAIDVLPRVVGVVAGRVPVLLDSGIRRGTDILKALALGARAVLLGRPYAYALSIGGASGVERVVRMLRHELETAMAFVGKRSIAELDTTVLWPH